MNLRHQLRSRQSPPGAGPGTAAAPAQDGDTGPERGRAAARAEGSGTELLPRSKSSRAPKEWGVGRLRILEGWFKD